MRSRKPALSLSSSAAISKAAFGNSPSAAFTPHPSNSQNAALGASTVDRRSPAIFCRRHKYAAGRLSKPHILKARAWQSACTSKLVFESLGSGLENYMTLLSVRERLVASNIANADTPGYTTKDIDFQASFQSALEAASPPVIEVEGLKIKNDGNNVNLDRESRMLGETNLRFNIASQLVRSEIKGIRNAIEEGKNG
jgi:flagellar basal-body rod protein FlgB